MRTASLPLVALLFLLAPCTALAQSARVARVLTLVETRPAVMVSGDRVWLPDATGALSACAGARCAPVVSTESCAVPRCPGGGTLLRVEHAIADVGDFPTDRDGFNREVDALRYDGAFAGISWAFGTHPDPVPQPSYSGPVDAFPSSRRGLNLALDFMGVGGGLTVTEGELVGGEIGGGFRWGWQDSSSDGEFFAVVFGNMIGVDARVRAFALYPVQGETMWSVLLGFAPGFQYAPQHERFVLPSLYGVLLPGLGVALRPDMPAAFYAEWSIPFTVLLDDHVGIEARVDGIVIDDWRPGDDIEFLLLGNLGLFVR